MKSCETMEPGSPGLGRHLPPFPTPQHLLTSQQGPGGGVWEGQGLCHWCRKVGRGGPPHRLATPQSDNSVGSSLTLPPHPGTKRVPHGGCDPLGAPILGQASLWGEETSPPLTWRLVGGDPAAPLSGQSHGVRPLGPVRVCTSPEMLNSRESTLHQVEKERLWKKEKSFIFYYLSWPFSLHFEQ